MTEPTTQMWLDEPPLWYRVTKFNKRAASIADRHYSRQTVGSDQTLAPGETLLMLTPDGESVWGAVHNMEPASDRRQWRVSIFRREGGQQASRLVLAATDMTIAYWALVYGMPEVPLRTEVDPEKTRRKRDPGRCFRRAGWELWSKDHRGLYLFYAPGERARLNIQGPVLR